jgi:hypothetical protein
MRVSHVSVGLAALLTIGLLLGGCRRASGPKFEPGDYTGTWLEMREPANPRFSVVQRPYVRELTINADRTFRMILKRPDGSAYPGNAVVEGTWQVGRDQLTLTAGNNTLSGDAQNATPASVSSLSNQDGTSVIFVTDIDDAVAGFRRQ